MALLLQVEGGFVFGLGMMLQEHVDYSQEGQPLYDSTWDYKIPTAACIPRQFNIALLKVWASEQTVGAGISGLPCIASCIEEARCNRVCRPD